MTIAKIMLRPVLLFVSITVLLACSAQSADVTSPTPEPGLILTNQAIFSDWEYQAERPGAVRWVDEGATYTALETAPGYEDAELEKDDYGDDIKLYEEIVSYDPATLKRSVLISLDQLKPEGSDTALVIDDYQWSDDNSKLLVYTSAKYVWRKQTVGLA